MNLNAQQVAHLLKTRLRISHFIFLDVVATEGSLHRAGLVQGVSQPAITRSLQEIEAAVGYQIFTRSKAGVEPTKVGSQLIAAARKMLKDIDRVSSAIVAAAHGDEGYLRIGYIPLVSRELLVDALQELVETRCYSFLLATGETTDILSRIREHRLDCGLVRYLGSERPSEMVFDRLYQQRAVFVRSARLGPIGPAPLAEFLANPTQKWIMALPATPTRLLIESLFLSAGRELPVPEFECYDVRMMEALLARDPARVTILPEDVTRELNASDPLVVSAAIEDLNLPAIYFVRPKMPDPDPGVAALFDILQSLVSPNGSAG